MGYKIIYETFLRKIRQRSISVRELLLYTTINTVVGSIRTVIPRYCFFYFCMVSIILLFICDLGTLGCWKQKKILEKKNTNAEGTQRTNKSLRPDRTGTNAHPHQRSRSLNTRGGVIGDFDGSWSTGCFLSVVGVCPQTKCSIVLTSRNPCSKGLFGVDRDFPSKNHNSTVVVVHHQQYSSTVH